MSANLATFNGGQSPFASPSTPGAKPALNPSATDGGMAPTPENGGGAPALQAVEQTTMGEPPPGGTARARP